MEAPRVNTIARQVPLLSAPGAIDRTASSSEKTARSHA